MTLISNQTQIGPFGKPNAYIEVYINQSATTTRSIPAEDIDTDLDFILTYISDIKKDFIYNDATKEITYLGVRNILIEMEFNISMERKDTGGSPEMAYFVQHNTGAGFSKITKSNVAREYTNLDVGTASNSFMVNLSSGDKLKMGLRTNAAIDLDYRNIVITIKPVDVNP